MVDESRTARASALEEKRRKLVEMRARREQRGDVDIATVRAAASSNLDDYIDGLLNVPAASAADDVQQLVDAEQVPVNTGSESTVAAFPSQEGQTQTKNNVIAVAGPVQKVTPAKNVETFEIGTQTAQEDFPDGEQQEEEEVPEEKVVEEANDDNYNDPQSTGDEEIAPKLLSPEEREQAVTSIPFSHFLNSASKKVERVLGAPVLADLLVNFVGENDGRETKVESLSDGSRFLSAQEVFECHKWTATRDVTDMDWSPLHRELMLSSYHMVASSGSTLGSAALSVVSPDDTPSASMVPRSGELQSDGLVLVWSLAMPSRPEHIFACGSPVLNARFHPTEAPLVIGGCQSGQLVIWDIRAGRLPVQRSDQGHAHPISGMEIIDGVSVT